MQSTPAEELSRRCVMLQRRLAESGLEAAIIVQNADLFYFTGTIQSGALFIPVEGPPLYLVRKELGRARRESAVERIVPFGSMRELPKLIVEHGCRIPERVGLELDVLPVNLYERYRKALPQAHFEDVTPLVRRVRALKSPHEITLMRAAAAQADRVYLYAREILREGMTDLEFTAELERQTRLEGHPGFARMRAFNGEMGVAHFMAGPETAEPSFMDTPLGGRGLHPAYGHGCSGRPIGRGEPVVFDIGSNVGGYLSDMTRILSIGPLSERLQRGYQATREIQALLFELARPGAIWGEIYERCHAHAVELGYADHFMGARGAQVSFIGHGLGIEIDEYPFLARGFDEDRLEVGMTFAFEPKVVFPGEGAVGIENTFLVGEQGIESLTTSDEALAVVAPGRR